MKPAYSVPARYAARWKAMMAGKSRVAAINMFCLQCVAFVPSEVRKCTAKDCPLYKWRPRRKDGDD